jgi:N-acetyl-alpha-D-muramate 1-phosphate uridylyltransferase
MKKSKMQMVIPCGGLATRLGELTKDTPKSMMDINGRPFLELQIELIKKYDFDELILCIGHLGEKIKDYFGNGKKYGIAIKYSMDNKLNVIGAIKNAEPLLGDSFFMLYGDSYLPALDFNDMYQKFTHQNKLALMAVWKNNNSIDKSNIKVRNGEVINVGEPDSDYIDYGVTVMRKNALKIVPTNQPFSTKSFWTKLSNMHELAAYEITDRFYHIGNKEGLDELITFIAKKKSKRT